MYSVYTTDIRLKVYLDIPQLCKPSFYTFRTALAFRTVEVAGQCNKIGRRGQACGLQECENVPLMQCLSCRLNVCFKHTIHTSHFYDNHSA